MFFFPIFFIFFSGLSLCGAGAGGFAVVILKRNQTRADLFTALTTFNSINRIRQNRIHNNGIVNQNDSKEDIPSFDNDLSIYSVVIDTKGISTQEFYIAESSAQSEFRKKLSDYLFL